MNFEEELTKGNFTIPECSSCKKIVWPPAEFCDVCYNETRLKSGQFTGKIIEFSNVKCDIIPCSSENYQASVDRPKFSLLDTKRIENHFSLNLYDWQNALKRCLKRIKYCEGE